MRSIASRVCVRVVDEHGRQQRVRQRLQCPRRTVPADRHGPEGKLLLIIRRNRVRVTTLPSGVWYIYIGIGSITIAAYHHMRITRSFQNASSSAAASSK